MRTRAVLVYDGDCGFCTTSAAFAQRRIRPDCAVTAWQFADMELLGITRQLAEHELLWVTPDGVVHGGAQAVAKLLLSAGSGWTVLGVLLALPPIRWVAHGVYRLIANNRERLPGGTAACGLPADRRPGSAG